MTSGNINRQADRVRYGSATMVLALLATTLIVAKAEACVEESRQARATELSSAVRFVTASVKAAVRDMCAPADALFDTHHGQMLVDAPRHFRITADVPRHPLACSRVPERLLDLPPPTC